MLQHNKEQASLAKAYIEVSSTFASITSVALSFPEVVCII